MFLNAFRRFVSRRGKPETVTCDNARIFLLGSRIINDCISTDDELSRTMSNQLIEWSHITPYSPWKGGFYERLIKTVKHALFMVIGKRIITKEQLCALLTEIEGCLNSLPLTYQESNLDDCLIILRPIDFIQKDIYISLPLEFAEEERTDPTYLPPSVRAELQTRLQTEKALRSSCALTERYWELWREQYLTVLREQHRRNIDNKRGCVKKSSRRRGSTRH
ncbi:hypothetical protein OESDEN_01077 [Oesophagostomum dentatum]|uniref:Integrase catalytic domain-containing protein n=1 Tax=Oesophagostomum dentatum TaxID=61180 RepID=A0A0B1TS27_OESDE|nr:hypothetical protein OESDEN_01077 [Oesophagostomum dentatum]